MSAANPHHHQQQQQLTTADDNTTDFRDVVKREASSSSPSSSVYGPDSGGGGHFSTTESADAAAVAANAFSVASTAPSLKMLASTPTLRIANTLPTLPPPRIDWPGRHVDSTETGDERYDGSADCIDGDSALSTHGWSSNGNLHGFRRVMRYDTTCGGGGGDGISSCSPTSSSLATDSSFASMSSYFMSQSFMASQYHQDSNLDRSLSNMQQLATATSLSGQLSSQVSPSAVSSGKQVGVQTAGHTSSQLDGPPAMPLIRRQTEDAASSLGVSESLSTGPLDGVSSPIVNKKRYVCEVCHKRFSTAWYVRVHRKSHNGERPYSCNMCGKGFMLANVLHVHVRKCQKNNQVSSISSTCGSDSRESSPPLPPHLNGAANKIGRPGVKGSGCKSNRGAVSRSRRSFPSASSRIAVPKTRGGAVQHHSDSTTTVLKSAAMVGAVDNLDVYSNHVRAFSDAPVSYSGSEDGARFPGDLMSQGAVNGSWPGCGNLEYGFRTSRPAGQSGSSSYGEPSSTPSIPDHLISPYDRQTIPPTTSLAASCDYSGGQPDYEKVFPPDFRDPTADSTYSANTFSNHLPNLTSMVSPPELEMQRDFRHHLLNSCELRQQHSQEPGQASVGQQPYVPSTPSFSDLAPDSSLPHDYGYIIHGANLATSTATPLSYESAIRCSSCQFVGASIESWNAHSCRYHCQQSHSQPSNAGPTTATTTTSGTADQHLSSIYHPTTGLEHFAHDVPASRLSDFGDTLSKLASTVENMTGAASSSSP